MRLLLALCIVCASGFYLPGVSPKTYKRGERMPVKVDKLTSIQTELPYDFYSLPFPEPEKGIKQDPENLGEYAYFTFALLAGSLMWAIVRAAELLPNQGLSGHE